MQAKKYPFFSSQFHPEKNSFEWHVDAIRSPIDAI
jgi:carbamoylphosphate synthase small subunit